MGADGVKRSHAQAWAELQEACRPRSAEGDRSSPSLWLLIQAARREPLLSAMYPWISMRQLGVSASDSWEEWGREPLPAMFARPDTYLVEGRPVGGERVALETADPAEAVAFAARLVRDRRAARTKGPHVWSAEVEAVLRGAGWYPGRSVDTTAWRERLEADGFHIHSAAEEFLREFGGLTVGSGGSGITSAREAFELDPLLALGEDDRFGDWGEEIGRRIAPLGEVDHGRFFLGLDEHGELYLVAGRPARFGRMPEALENLVLGVMPVHMPDPPQL
ncbi:SUKH-3 domain-containing protein [Streptomyces fulvoviolaceus]|uniref:SUKH-3 domain-containing protein n=1 Tax=Streptomyces fulvoviolaceus TaxID=285535 RepID=UPI0021BF0903|nr:SUKH-3 domain-containing protein [Streptomyces fulvoviolaceus]MCT9080902.1 SUKH-3 domain-containing protein [Streptomyces fulvoviolaceus]